jgi:hypothetical protein
MRVMGPFVAKDIACGVVALEDHEPGVTKAEVQGLKSCHQDDQGKQLHITVHPMRKWRALRQHGKAEKKSQKAPIVNKRYWRTSPSQHQHQRAACQPKQETPPKPNSIVAAKQ